MGPNESRAEYSPRVSVQSVSRVCVFGATLRRYLKSPTKGRQKYALFTISWTDGEIAKHSLAKRWHEFGITCVPINGLRYYQQSKDLCRHLRARVQTPPSPIQTQRPVVKAHRQANGRCSGGCSDFASRNRRSPRVPRIRTRMRCSHFPPNPRPDPIRSRFPNRRRPNLARHARHGHRSLPTAPRRRGHRGADACGHSRRGTRSVSTNARGRFARRQSDHRYTTRHRRSAGRRSSAGRDAVETVLAGRCAYAHGSHGRRRARRPAQYRTRRRRHPVFRHQAGSGCIAPRPDVDCRRHSGCTHRRGRTGARHRTDHGGRLDTGRPQSVRRQRVRNDRAHRHDCGRNDLVGRVLRFEVRGSGWRMVVHLVAVRSPDRGKRRRDWYRAGPAASCWRPAATA